MGDTGPLVIDISAIEAWKAKQKDRIQLPTSVNIDALLQRDGQRPGASRLFYLAYAGMFIFAMVGCTVFLLPPIWVAVGPQIGRIIVIFVSFTIYGGMLTMVWRSLVKVIGQTPIEERLWRAGLARVEISPTVAAYCLSQALTYAYSTRILARWPDVVEHARSWCSGTEVPRPLAAVLRDLLFAEIWLDRAFNSDKAYSGVEHRFCLEALKKLSCHSPAIIEFVELVRKMGGSGEQHHAVIKELDQLMTWGRPLSSEPASEDQLRRPPLQGELIYCKCPVNLYFGMFGVFWKSADGIVTNKRLLLLAKEAKMADVEIPCSDIGERFSQEPSGEKARIKLDDGAWHKLEARDAEENGRLIRAINLCMRNATEPTITGEEDNTIDQTPHSDVRLTQHLPGPLDASDNGVEINLLNCHHCGTQGMIPMSDGRCPNCKKPLNP